MVFDGAAPWPVGRLFDGAAPWPVGICFEGACATAEADTQRLNATAPIKRFQVMDVFSVRCIAVQPWDRDRHALIRSRMVCSSIQDRGLRVLGILRILSRLQRVFLKVQMFHSSF